MKAKLFAIGLLLFALATCVQKPQVPELVEGPTHNNTPSLELQSIDTQMWRQPDSALMRLLPWFDTCCRDTACHVSTATAYNRHYANLLLSELLYKNDYPQTNRRELQQAVAYFDSISQVPEPVVPEAPRRVEGPSNRIAFLDARAHYINGVGYYENDSVVEACKEYLKALEVMEGHFEEKELVGEKARFMALTYTHLTGLFSDQYLHDQAIYFGKKALGCYQKYEATPWHLAWMFCEIGSQYEMEGVLDSAVCFYQRGEEILPDTNNLSHRDIASRLAFLSYVQEDDCTYSLIRLKLLLGQAESPKEYFARCVTIGRIHLCEKDYDSAWIYLNKVFHESQNIDSKKQAAEWLVDICKTKGWDSKIMEYAEFLVPFANLNENQSHLKSQITTLFQIYEQERLKISHRKQLMTISRYVSASLITMAILSSVVLAFLFVYKKRHKQLNSQKEVAEKQLESERFAHEMKQKALAGKLTRSNEALRIQKEEKEELLKELRARQKQKDWSRLDDFIDEDICKEILLLLQGKTIKREAKREDYPELHLDTSQLSRLNTAVEKHFRGFGRILTDHFPKINSDEIKQCQLYLLNLEDVQIAHLLHCDYSTVKKRSTKLKKAFGTEKELQLFVRGTVL